MTTDIKLIIEDALKVLISSWEDGGAHFVSTPIQYPSGSLAVVEINGGTSTVLISDRAVGYWEAESYGAENSYAKSAAVEAANRGLRFDGHSIIALEVPMSRLTAGIIAVANASAFAAAEAIKTEATKKMEGSPEELFERVKFAFPDSHISKSLEISGERAIWEAHNVVSLHDDRKAIFEPVSPHSSSVTSKFMMFVDLAKRPTLILNAVFENPEKLDPKSRMISEVAHIMSANSDAVTFRNAA